MIFNPLVIWLVRSPLHGLVSGSTMVVEYTGKKSGKKYAVPVNYLVDGQELFTISTRERTWWRSMRRSQVMLRLKGRDMLAGTEVLENLEAVAGVLMLAAGQSAAYRKALGIGMEAGGSPNYQDAFLAAQTRVVIRFHLCE